MIEQKDIDKLIKKYQKISAYTKSIDTYQVMRDLNNLGKPDLKANRTKLLVECEKDIERLHKRRARSSSK